MAKRSSARGGKPSKKAAPKGGEKAKPKAKPSTKVAQGKAKDTRPKITNEDLIFEIFRAIEAGNELHLGALQKKYAVSEKQFSRALEGIGLSEGKIADEDAVEDIIHTLEGGKRLIEKGFIVTSLDLMVDILQKEGKLDVRQAAKIFNVPEEKIEEWARLLERTGYGKLVFPLNVTKSAVIYKGKALKPKKSLPLPEEKKLLQTYLVVADKVPTKINIFDAKKMVEPLYQVVMPKVGPVTEEVLDLFVEKLAEHVNVSHEHIADPNLMAALKGEFAKQAAAEIERQLPNTDPKVGTVLAGLLLHKAFGLGPLESLMADNHLEEIAINGAHTPITVYHRSYGWCRSTIKPKNEQECYNCAAQIGRKVGRQITSLEPLMDAHLLTGDRVNATLFPISGLGNTVTIRKFARNPWTIVNFIDPKNHTISSEMAALLWLCMQYELNILVAGGTASGKTSLLNSLCALTPPNQRLITIEDTRELALPKYLTWNWVPLTTRNANPEGRGAVEMIDLMVSALRMRPDRVILGEIRRRKEAEVLFEAMHTGHSVYSTMHADNVEQVYRRLVEPPIQVPESEIEALHVVLTQFRDRRTGRRRTYEIAEVIAGGYEEKLDFNVMYKWSPRDDVFEKLEESQRVFNDLNIHTGMTQNEIQSDLRDKKKILEWMLDKGLSDIDQVGEVMRYYYKNPGSLARIAARKGSPEKVL